jgi:Fe-S oxidoreductase
MCPSYMATRDETHTTRGRANALRLVMTGELGEGGWSNETLHDALDLCLQCKACKSECPSNVDMAKLKAEVLHQSYKGRPVPLGSLLMGHIYNLNPIGSLTAPLANATVRNSAFKWLLEKAAGIDRRRTLPTFAFDHFRKWFRRHAPDPHAGSRGSVLLLDDCFTTYNTPSIGRAAVTVLEAAGYRVELAGLRCCGRPAISKGLLGLGRELARENVAKLVGHARRGVPIVGLEPSCLMTLVDEYRDFRIGPDADLVAKSAVLVDAFIAENGGGLEFTSQLRRVLLHGHCQQRALVGTAGTIAALKLVPGLEVTELDSGCCGMAGSFGYELGHFEVSKALAERVILPAVAADPEARLVAPGFSCRSQVHGLADIEAVHPVELLAEAIGRA